MMSFQAVVTAYGTPDFAQVFVETVQRMDAADLPLQQGLRQSNYVSPSPHRVVILASEATEKTITVRAGIFYAGIVAGSCCSDDPAPMCEQTEHCELYFTIDRKTTAIEIAMVAADS